MLCKFETYQDDPMFHQLSYKFDLPGYSGLMTTFLKKSENSVYELFPKSEAKTNNSFEVPEHVFEKHFEESKHFYHKIRNKKLCPMLEKYRDQFFDDSFMMQSSKFLINDESFQTQNNILNSLDQSEQCSVRFDQMSIIEEFERMSFAAEEENMGNILNELSDYQVDNYSEKKRLHDELDVSQSNSNLKQMSKYSFSSQASPLISKSQNLSEKKLENNLFSKEFQYWACMEPEKWKFKAKRIKTSKKTSKRKYKKKSLHEKYEKDFKLIFDNEEEILDSQDVIQTMKNIHIYRYDSEELNLYLVDPVLPINPNTDIPYLFLNGEPALILQNAIESQEEKIKQNIHILKEKDDQNTLNATQIEQSEVDIFQKFQNDTLVQRYTKGQQEMDITESYQSLGTLNENTMDMSQVSSELSLISSSIKISYFIINAKKSLNSKRLSEKQFWDHYQREIQKN
jgi:hypothetical protein